LALLASLGQTAPVSPLTAARDLYNQGRYDEAISEATRARAVPADRDAAAVVLARAHLERYRRQGDAADIDAAQAALRAVAIDALSAADHLEFLMGLGLSVYLDDRDRLEDRYSIAAELFETALERADGVVDPVGRERILEWWCGALDRQAQFGPASGQVPIYQRILARIDREFVRDDSSIVVLYWRMAAARGAGDLERAWGAAVAGWLRARYFGERGLLLRADIDRFVNDVLLPERAEHLTPDADPRPTLDLLTGGWREFKTRWQAPSP
jgi:hypothetical protein